MLHEQSGVEATILTGLTRSWNMIANQTDHRNHEKGSCPEKLTRLSGEANT
jgi:hypothetical protein